MKICAIFCNMYNLVVINTMDYEFYFIAFRFVLFKLNFCVYIVFIYIIRMNAMHVRNYYALYVIIT